MWWWFIIYLLGSVSFSFKILGAGSPKVSLIGFLGFASLKVGLLLVGGCFWGFFGSFVVAFDFSEAESGLMFEAVQKFMKMLILSFSFSLLMIGCIS